MAGLKDAHISELHRLAADQGVEGYRMLRREQLIDSLEADGGAQEADGGDVPSTHDSGEAEQAAAQGSDVRVEGVLEVMPQRFGFIRVQGLGTDERDIYISASQIRRCELKAGDLIAGPVREPRRGERHRALVRVETVNGADPGGDRTSFDDLVPVAPTRRIPLGDAGGGEGELLLRAADLLAPLAFGQRVLVAAAQRSGRTTLLRALASAVGSNDSAELIVLLVDERPEEATRWRESFPDADLAIATADMRGSQQAHVAELALARARRLAESGTDVVMLVDSLSRLAVTRREVGDAKRLFGSGRELAGEESGSLTVVATVLGGAEDPVTEAVATTENALIALDPELAALGIYPAIDASASRVSDEEQLRESDELDAIRRIRSLLADLPPREAAAMLRERIEGAASNAELLGST